MALGTVLTGVTWCPDGKNILFTLGNGEIHIYDENGNFTSKLNIDRWGSGNTAPDLDSKEEPIICVRWYSGPSLGVITSVPNLAIVWKQNGLHLLRGTSDESMWIYI